MCVCVSLCMCVRIIDHTAGVPVNHDVDGGVYVCEAVCVSLCTYVFVYLICVCV